MIEFEPVSFFIGFIIGFVIIAGYNLWRLFRSGRARWK